MWIVTRQRPYYQNQDDTVNLVEIAWGGRDYSGSDALSAKYPGEFEEFIEAIEALKAAISIRDKWNADDPDAFALVGHGSTGGGLCEIEPSDETDEQLMAWAVARDAKLERCYCGKVIVTPRYNADSEWSGETFCREYCAERAENVEEEEVE